MTAALANIADFSQFASLRAAADRNDPAVLREVASQFEALFVQSLMKNMRGAKLAEPMFGSDRMDMYQDLFDQQIALEMSSGKGLGLAEMLVRQLGGEAAGLPRAQSAYAPAAPPLTGSTAAEPVWESPDDFVADIWPHAERAGRALGVAPQAIVAQAALETGWGRHVMRRGDGEPGYNLFGIKAGSGWTGDAALKPTLEYEDGIARRRTEAFRAYPDLAAAFDDYVRLVGGRERYAAATGTRENTAQFASALQSAGYATDPDYASKLTRVAGSDTMKQALDALKNPAGRPIREPEAPVAGD